MPSNPYAMPALPGLPSLQRGTKRLPRLPGLLNTRAGVAMVDPALPRPGEESPAPWLLPPVDWYGSVPDYAIYWAAVQVYGDGLDTPGAYYGGEEWSYKVGVYGQFLPAGFIPDFMFYDVNVTVNIFQENVEPELERVRARILRALDPPIYHVIIDSEHAVDGPSYYLQEALNGVSHSQIGDI